MKRATFIFCLLLTIFSVAKGYSVFEANGKVGLKNEAGKVLIPAKYEALGWSDGEFSVVSNAIGYKSHNKWGLISLANQIITKAEFEDISPAEASMLIARKKSPTSLQIVCGIITSSGKEVIPFLYHDIKVSSLRAIVFTRQGNQYKYGLVDLENRILIPQQFKNIRSIGSLRYAVENFENKWALYTEDGKQISSFTIDSISTFQKNYAVVYQGLYQGLIDREGVMKVEAKYREIKINNDGTISYRQSPTWLFLDGQNNLKQKALADSISGIAKNLLKFRSAGVIQLADYTLNLKAGPRIHELQNFRKGRAIFSVDGKYGVVTDEGKVVIEPRYSHLQRDAMFYISNIKQGNKNNWVVLDSIGKPLHTKPYDAIHPFNGEFFPVTNRNFWGAINPSGKEILSCTYDSILQQFQGNVVVKFHGQYGVINEREHWLVAPRSNKLRLISEDRFLEYAQKTTYLKSFDNSIIYFTENRLQVNGDILLEYLPSGTIWEIGMNGVITNRILLPDLVEKIYPETEGLRGIKKNGQYGFIDSQGRLRIANRYDDIQPFSEQLAAMKIRGRWGFIGHDDRIAIQPIYDEVSDFKHGLSIVKQKGFFGVVDKTGKQVVLPRYNRVQVLPNKNIIIEQGGLVGLADAQGRILINTKYNKIDDLNNGYIIVQRDGKYGAITSQGISTIPLMYDYLSYDPSNNIFLAMVKSEWIDVKL
ncbi:WG repeat-containing protein [Chryseolinea sp. H1M3-3]|uniref:WG repeat-containing protein n=1 Tax=Chryseolinea sp. H1M3-3 TaxID=3034144 RepID=UPI0023EC69AD|nr:WG repeat-containing protein [Chryseolinea sp. H1M3-3]